MQHRRLLALLGAAATLVAAAPAGAAPPAGQTLLLDQLTNAPLPFDGAGRATLTTQPLSADGRWLVFSSSADSLLPGDDDSGVHVYRLDRSTGVVQQVDVGAGGEQLGVALRADGAQVSADGSRVAFMLRRPAGGATALPEGVYVKDLASGALELASRATGADGAPAVVGTFAFSGDGGDLAFTATAPLHTDRGDGGNDDVYLRDLGAAVTARLDHRGEGTVFGTVATEKAPSIDFAGDVVAFAADAGPGPDDRADGVDDLYVSIAAALPTQFATGVEAVALAGGAESLAFLRSGGVWVTRGNGFVKRVDVPRSGGSAGSAFALAFEPVADARTAPAHLSFVSSGTLDPTADRNHRADLYTAPLDRLGDPAAVELRTSGATDGDATTGATAAGVAVFAAAAPDLPAGDPVDAQVYERLPAGAAPPEARDLVRSLPPSPAPRADTAGDAAVRTLHAVSDDGSRVVFSSDAAAFGARVVPAPITGAVSEPQVLLRDADGGTTTVVSVALDGTPGAGASREPTIDGAGRRVAFLSTAADLVPDTPPRSTTQHAYVRDLDSGVTRLVDRTSAGLPLPYGVNDAVLSGDGRHLVYATSDGDAPGAPNDRRQHVFLVDLDSGATTLVDRMPGSDTPGDGYAQQPDVSRDGSRVAFLSDASNLGVPGRHDPQAYVRDLRDGSTIWASVPEDGDPQHGVALELSLSGDGRQLAFAQGDSAFGWGMPAGRSSIQIFVRDLAGATTALASAGAAGDAFADEAVSPSLDGDGSHLAFVAATGDPGRLHGHQVYLRDRLGAATTLLSLAAGGTPSRDGARSASVSADGRCVAFDSASGDLGGGYGPDHVHAYLRCLGGSGDRIDGGGGGGDGVVEPSPRRDRTAPRITRARLSVRRFAVVRPAKRSERAAASRARRRVLARGTRIAFTLSEAARVTVAVERSLPGRRRGSACVAPRRGRKRRCTRVVTVATPLVRQLGSGKRTLLFSGRYGRRALRPGSYRLRLVARDSAGNSSRPVRLAFTVVEAPT